MSTIGIPRLVTLVVQPIDVSTRTVPLEVRRKFGGSVTYNSAPARNVNIFFEFLEALSRTTTPLGAMTFTFFKLP